MGSAWKTENFVGVVYKNPLSGNQCCQLETIYYDAFQEKRLILYVWKAHLIIKLPIF